MVKDSDRLLRLIKMVGGDTKTFNQTSFVKLTKKVFKKQKKIVPSPELLAFVWENIKNKRKEPLTNPEVGMDELCSYLDLTYKKEHQEIFKKKKNELKGKRSSNKREYWDRSIYWWEHTTDDGKPYYSSVDNPKEIVWTLPKDGEVVMDPEKQQQRRRRRQSRRLSHVMKARRYSEAKSQEMSGGGDDGEERK